jgi:hypothetical protein
MKFELFTDSLRILPSDCPDIFLASALLITIYNLVCHVRSVSTFCIFVSLNLLFNILKLCMFSFVLMQHILK